MTWQDELRRLDEEMTAGRLSSDDYQRRRDELMAEQNQTAAEQQGQSSPFPPAFRWEATEPSSQSTEKFRPIGHGGEEASEQTQVVSRSDQAASAQQQAPSGEQAGQQAPGSQQVPGRPPSTPFDDSERTQVVQAGLPPPPVYGTPTYQQQESLFTPAQNSAPPWGRQDSAPPWAASDQPPIQEPNAGWMMQGPESFERQDSPGRTGRIVAIAGAVVVLLLVGVGAFFLFKPSGSEPGPGPTTAAPAPPPAPAPPQGPPLAELTGDVKDTAALTDFSQVNQLGYLTDGEMQTLAHAGPGEARFALADDGPNRSIILVVQAREAPIARDQLSDLQVQFNLTERDGPAGVRVAGDNSVPNGPPVLRRAHYVSGDYVVRVQVTGNSVSEVQRRFDQLLAAQLAKMPADG